MQQGIHVVERHRLAALAREGLDVPQPWHGILDGLRMTQGLASEPPERRPLTLTGLDALLLVIEDDATHVLRSIRDPLMAARRYFTWKQIPLVLLLEGEIEDRRDGSGLHLRLRGHRWSLGPLLGTKLEPAFPHITGWWWASHFG